MKPWQKGFDLSYLKNFGALFKRVHSRHVYGAFGLTKERDVAESLSKKSLIWTGDPPSAAILFSVLKQNSRHLDFRGEPILLESPSVLVKAFAADDVDCARKVLNAIIKRTQPINLYFEIFEEDEVAKSVINDAGGFCYLGTKIMAGSEVKGLYRYGETSLSDYDESEVAVLSVLQEDFISSEDLKLIASEVLGQTFAQHYSSYNKRQTWTAFALRGYSDDPFFIQKPTEMSKSWKAENPSFMKAKPRWTQAGEFPVTRKVLDRVGFGFDRVRFMKLSAGGGELSRHADITDRDAGVADGKLARLHIPIITNDAVTFYSWGLRGQAIQEKFGSGCMFYLDQRKPHRVINNSNLDRVHLVMDCISNSRMRELIRASV